MADGKNPTGSSSSSSSSTPQFKRVNCSKENTSVSGKPPINPSYVKENENLRSEEAKKSGNTEGEKNSKEGQSFFLGKFGESSWRASPIMQDYVMRSRSVLEVKREEIISSLRSTSVPRASDLRQQRSKVTPPPFTSIVGSSGLTYEAKESRKSTPSPLGMASWNDVSPFTAKRRQGLGSAPPWSGVKGDESWQKGSANSRSPSPQSIIGAPLPFFSRTPPKLVNSTGRKEPKSDTRPGRVNSGSNVRVRNLIGPPVDSKFPRYNFRSLTPTSVMHNRKNVTQLRSIHQGSVLPAIINLERKSASVNKAPVASFSSGGAFKAVQRGGQERVHRLSKSLQKMGLGGQQSQKNQAPDSALLSENSSLMGSLKMLKVPENETEEGKDEGQSEAEKRASPVAPLEVASSKSQIPSEVKDSTSELKQPTGGSFIENVPPQANAYEQYSSEARNSHFEDNTSKNNLIYRQEYDQQGWTHPSQMLAQQQSNSIGPGGPYIPRQQYLQSAQYSPQQYSYPSPYSSPQYAPGVPPMAMQMPHLQLQAQIPPPHMVQSKPFLAHATYQGSYGVNSGVDGGTNMGYAGLPSQYATPNGMPSMVSMRFPSSEMHYPSHVPQNTPQGSHQKSHKKHENSRNRASMHPSIQELQSKLTAMLNQPGNSGEVDQFLPMFEGRVTLLAKTQSGSRFLQQRIAEGHPGYFSLVIKEVLSDLPELMVDLFGNYLCQKLIEKCNEQQRDNMLAKLANHFPHISCDRQGTRAVQKIVGATTTHQQREVFMSSISRESDLLRLMRDSNGSHVIHAVLDKFPLSMVTPIFNLAYKTCYKLAVHQHGLCVLKKCMTLAKPKDFMNLSEKVLLKVLQLVNDQYGNYLIQHIIDRSIINKQNSTQGDHKESDTNGDAIKLLHSRLKSHYCGLSRQKFSSNVVEKCLRVGSTDWQADIIEELMDRRNTSGTSVRQLLEDSYGNYVMQNALNVAAPSQASALVGLIKPQLNALRKSIRKKWERLIVQKMKFIAGEPLPSTTAPPKQQHSWNNQGKQRNNYQRGGRNRQNQGQNRRNANKKNSNGNAVNYIQQVYPDPYNSTVPGTMQPLHDAMIRSQPAQIITPSQFHPSSQMHPNMQGSMMTHYPQATTYVQQIGYPQPGQVFLDPHMSSHVTPSY